MYPNLNIFGMTIGLYRTMYVVGFVGMFVMCLLSGKKYKISKLRAVIYTLITFGCGVAGAKLMSKIYVASMLAVSGGEYLPDSGVCLFGALMFLPVFMFILSLVSGEKFRKLMDYMTPGIFFILACAKFGCSLGGCCHGIFTESGIYNHKVEAYTFPVQLYESLCTFVVVAVLLIIMIKRGKVRYGALYPCGTILYCTARFIWENFRYYEYECEFEFFLGLTFWQCWAILAIVVSVVWLIVLYAQPKWKTCALENDFKKYIDRFDRLTADSAEKKREKHKAKAKAHAQKAKELKKRK